MKRIIIYFLSSILLFLPCFLEAQQKKIDSLLNVLKTVKEDTTRVNILNALCKRYTDVCNYEQALSYGKQAQEEAEMLSYPKGEADSYKTIGIIYMNQGDFEKALENYLKAFKIFTEIGNKNGIANSYNNIGLIYWYQANYEKALQNHFNSLKIREVIGNKKDIASSYNNIALIYWTQGNYEKALQYHFKSLKINEEFGDKRGIAVSHANIGLIYWKYEEYEKALDNYLKALKIYEEIGYKQGIASSYGNIANIYYTRGNYEKSLGIYLKNLKINEEIGNMLGIATSYLNIGNIYKIKGKLKESNLYLNQSLILYKKIGSKDGLKDAYSALSELYDKKGDYKQAYNYHKLYSDIKDTLLNIQSRKQIAELQIKYDTEKKEKENIQLAQKNHIQQIEIEREKVKRRTQLIILISFLTLAIIVFILLYYRSKFIQKTIMEKEISLQQKLRFKAVISAEENECRRIAQELHDGLGQLLSTVKLNIYATENFIEEPGKVPLNNLLSLIDTACDEVRTISHNLIPGVLIRLGLLSALRELVRKINVSQQLTVNMEINFDDRIDELAEVTIYRIIQEVLNNIIKHSQAKIVTLTLKRTGDDFFMQITDDGKGFDTTLIEKSEGLGWKNIYSRSSMLNGTVDVLSTHSVGTTVKIYFQKLFSDM